MLFANCNLFIVLLSMGYNFQGEAMNRGQKFAKRTLIYMVGSFGSKILSFLLLPLYTHLIPASEYGQYDLIITTISLIIPLVTLQTQEAIISGMIADDIENEQIIKATNRILLINIFVTIIVCILLNKLYDIQYFGFILGIIVIRSIMITFQQYVRGLGNSLLYASVGVVYTIIFLTFNIILVCKFKLGIYGLFVSEIIASTLIVVIILILEGKKIININCNLNLRVLKWVVKYSFPLVPNAISWWFISASDRYVINIFLGDTANGVYAISYKFANILQTVASLMYLSWQEISLEEYKKKDMAHFLSTAFNIYARFLIPVAMVAFFVTKYIIQFMFAQEYQEAWKYTGWLFLGTAYIAMSSQLNTCYLVQGKTTKILTGTLIAGAVNIIVDLIFVKTLGLYSACISTAISAFVLIVIRIFDNKKYYDLEIDKFTFWGMSFFATFIFILNSCCYNGYFLFVCFVISVFIFIFLNRKTIVYLYKMLRDKIKTRYKIQ